MTKSQSVKRVQGRKGRGRKRRNSRRGRKTGENGGGQITHCPMPNVPVYLGFKAPQREETRFFPQPLTGSGVNGFLSIPTTAHYFDMASLLAQSLDYQGRTGRAIKPYSLEVFGTLVGGQANVATDDQRNTVRILIVQAPPNWVPPSTYLNLFYPGDPRLFNVNKILFDEEYILASPGRDGTGYMPAVQQVHISCPLRGTTIEFSGTGVGTDTNETFFLVAVSDSSVVPNPGFVNGSAVLYWTE